MGKIFEGIERPEPEVEAVGLLKGEAVKTEAEALAGVQAALADLAKAKESNG